MGTIDITTIATIRPSVLFETFESLKTYLCFNGGFRLILDVAPIGEEGKTRDDVVKVAEEFFPFRLVRLNRVSLQAEAQKWAWASATSEYVIQWEDDWKLLRKVCVNEICSLFADPMVAMVSFDRQGKSVKDYAGYKGVYKQVDKNLFQRVKFLNFGGPPSIINRKYLQRALGYMKGRECLDVTCERADSQGFLKQWKFLTVTHLDGAYVQDLGKPWMKAQGFKRNKRTPQGMKWYKS